jgi:FAD/FMN-containing dehydrogenase
LSAELAKLLPELDGSYAARGGDGRFKSSVMQPLLPDDERALYDKIKEIFDPLGIFNPGIKCVVPPKDLAAELNAWCRLQG